MYRVSLIASGCGPREQRQKMSGLGLLPADPSTGGWARALRPRRQEAVGTLQVQSAVSQASLICQTSPVCRLDYHCPPPACLVHSQIIKSHIDRQLFDLQAIDAVTFILGEFSSSIFRRKSFSFLSLNILETSFFHFLSKVTNITLSLQTGNVRINEMEDCNPGYAIRRKDKQIVEIQKRDKRHRGPVQAGEQTYLGTPSETSCAQHPGERRAESKW